MKALLVAVLFASACTVGSSTGGSPTNGPTSPDAAMQSGSNSNNNGSNTGSNTGSNSNLPACTGALYDPCTSNSQCTSANCKTFSAQGIEVCTTTCTPGDNTPCGAGTCNNMGICKPPAANACSR